jgi:hypothetical protein
VPTVLGFAKKTSSTTLASGSYTEVGEAAISLSQASAINVNASLTAESTQFQTITCLVKIDGSQVSNEERASVTQTVNSGELEDDIANMDVVGSSIYRGSGSETFASGSHTAEVFCTTTEVHTPAVVKNVAIAWTAAS